MTEALDDVDNWLRRELRSKLTPVLYQIELTIHEKIQEHTHLLLWEDAVCFSVPDFIRGTMSESGKDIHPIFDVRQILG